jgi:hypothetical protein
MLRDIHWAVFGQWQFQSAIVLNELIPNDANVELVLDELVPKAAGTCNGDGSSVCDGDSVLPVRDGLVRDLPTPSGEADVCCVGDACDGDSALPVCDGLVRSCIGDACDGDSVLPVCDGLVRSCIGDACDGDSVLPVCDGLVRDLPTPSGEADVCSHGVACEGDSVLPVCDGLRFGGMLSDACDGSSPRPNDIILYSKSMTVEEIRTAPVIIPAGAIDQVVKNLKCAICKGELGGTEFMLKLLPYERVCQNCEGDDDYRYDEESDYYSDADS